MFNVFNHCFDVAQACSFTAFFIRNGRVHVRNLRLWVCVFVLLAMFNGIFRNFRQLVSHCIRNHLERTIGAIFWRDVRLFNPIVIDMHVEIVHSFRLCRYACAIRMDRNRFHSWSRFILHSMSRPFCRHFFYRLRVRSTICGIRKTSRT